MLYRHYREMAAKAPPHAGIWLEGGVTPYAATAERIERIASGLLVAGIAPGDPVAVMVPSSAIMHEITYALFAIGAVVVPVDMRAGAAELAFAGQRCAIAAVIARNDRLAAGVAILEAAGRPNGPVIPLSDMPGSDIETMARGPVIELPEPGRDIDAVYLFSSGSTGRPKVVPHTHGEFMALGANSQKAMGLNPDDKVLNPLPAHHAFGFMSAQIEAAFSGASTLFWSDPAPLLVSRDRIVQTIEGDRITVLPGVPFMFKTLAGSTREADLGCVRLAYSGGIALDRQTYEAFTGRFGIALDQGLGSTEAGHITLTEPDTRTKPYETAGRPMGDNRIEIRPHSDAPDGQGEIFVYAGAVTRGYLGPDAIANTGFEPGGYLTGDLGYLDEEGSVCVTGRAKLVIEIAGEKVDPAEVEDVLRGHHAVSEAVVVGEPSGRGDTRLKAVVVRTEEVRDAELLRYCQASLSPFKVPEIVRFIDAIPKSATGKILRGQLIDA